MHEKNKRRQSGFQQFSALAACERQLQQIDCQSITVFRRYWPISEFVVFVSVQALQIGENFCRDDVRSWVGCCFFRVSQLVRTASRTNVVYVPSCTSVHVRSTSRYIPTSHISKPTTQQASMPRRGWVAMVGTLVGSQRRSLKLTCGTEQFARRVTLTLKNKSGEGKVRLALRRHDDQHRFW